MSATAVAKNIFRTLSEVRQKKSLYQRVRDYRGYVGILYETDDFRVTTASSGIELLKILELRHEIFVEEWQGRRAFHGLDVDGYDFIADHLMIVDKRIDEVVGTYRLLSSHFTHNFYSAHEFNLENFLRLPAVKLELGRACVHENYRDGAAIDLLWKGLTQYIAKTKTDFLFGCSSLKQIDARAITRFCAGLRGAGQWSDDFAIRPTEDYRFPGFLSGATEALGIAERRAMMPPLLRSYLNAGATVHGWPALDRDFACTDLLTILDWKRLNQRFQVRFMAKG